MDDFGIEYVGERHIHNLRDVLKQYYEMTEDCAGTKFAGIDIEWNYATKRVNRTCRLCTVCLETIDGETLLFLLLCRIQTCGPNFLG